MAADFRLLPERSYSDLLSDIEPDKRPGLEEALDGSPDLSTFWDTAPRADWMLKVLHVAPSGAVSGAPSEQELRLFACWCAEQTGGADPWIKLALRGDIKQSFFEEHAGDLRSAALAGSVHGAVRRVSQLRAQAAVADEDALAGAITAADALATYRGARRFPEPVAVFVTTRQPIPGYRDPLSEVGKIELDTAEAAVAERQIAAAARRYLGNPFAGTPPTVPPEEIQSLLTVAPVVREPEACRSPALTLPDRPPAGRRKNRILLDESDDFALEELVLSRAGRRGLQLEWLSIDYEEGHRNVASEYRSEPLTTATAFLEAIQEVCDASEERFDLRDAREAVVGAVRRLGAPFADDLDVEWKAGNVRRANRSLTEDIIFALGRLVDLGHDDPTQWGLTKDLRVVPVLLEPALNLAALQRRARATCHRKRPPRAWVAAVKEWVHE